VLLTINLLTVKAFGEIEFWFALIKIIAILSLIGVGLCLTATRFISPEGYQASVTNIWSYGGFFPKGMEGVIAGFQTAVFAFVGMEIVGTTAAEVRNPGEVMPRAINTIPVRILTFYLGTLAILMMVTPWPHIPSQSSPFVGMFALTGFAAAASVVNFVVVSSALSSTNSGIYSTSRMLYGLSWHRDASALFGKLSSRGVPANGLLLAAILLLSAAALLAAGGSVMDAFQMVGSVASLLFIFVWAIILMCYLTYRRRRPHLHHASSFKMPAGPLMSYVVLAFFLFLLVALAEDATTRISILILPVWFLLLAFLYFRKIRKTTHHISRRQGYLDKVAKEKTAAAAFLSERR
jgi:D-serine/D-alanine/glycine transporter